MRRFSRAWDFLNASRDYLQFVSTPGRDLVAGPYIGEFGYECMEWQSFVNAQVGHYDNVYVVTYPGREALYPGCQLIPHDVSLDKAGYMHGFTPTRILYAMAREQAQKLGLSSYRILQPHMLAFGFYRAILPQRWLRLGTDAPARFDLVFHFRNIVKSGGDQRINFPLESADRLASLCAGRGFACGAIGHPEFSYCPPGVTDCRSINLRATIDAISSSNVMVGQLSGPTHLANLCPRDAITWAEGQNRFDACRDWNPHHARLEIVSNQTFSPPPEEILRVIEDYFKSRPRQK